MKKYDHLVILCASSADDQGMFKDIADDNSYLGGHLRMEAGVLAAEQTDGDIIVIGGDAGEQYSKEKWRQSEDMAEFLLKNGININRIIKIASQADTLGGLRALYVTSKSRLRGTHVGLLTNEYHLPRTVLIANDPQFQWLTDFVPVSAESYVTHSPGELKKYSPALQLRLDREAQGVKDWKQGKYNRQHLPEAEWLGEQAQKISELGRNPN